MIRITYTCIKIISGSGSLLNHLKKKHNVFLETQQRSNDPERFRCTVPGCGKIFKAGFVLQDHMNIHTGQKPHICQYCKQGFASKANKYAHVKATHLGIKRRSK